MSRYIDYSDDLRVEKKRLENLKQKQITYKRLMLPGLIMIPLGLFLMRYVVVGRVLFFGNILYGPALIGGGIWLIWRGFINSDGRTAVSLAKKLRLYTLENRKEDCAVKIGEIRRKMERTQKQMQNMQEQLYGGKKEEPSELGDLDWLKAGGEIPKKWDGTEK